MAVAKTVFGKTPEGKEVELYTITNKNGMSAEVITFGAILKSLYVPDKKGKVKDVVLGYDKLWMYFKNGCFFGATVGPSANRIGGGSYVVDGKKVQLPVNDHKINNLHSDKDKGFHKRLWKAEAGKNSVTFTLSKKDKDLGPGNATFSVTYTLTDANELKIAYHATSDKKTLINMTNHSYFNLQGPESMSMEETVLTINASKFTETDRALIPTGKFIDVDGTPMDFRKPKKIGRDIGKIEYKPLKICGGYDHNYVIDGWNGKKKLIAVAEEKKSGRKMEVYSDLPGVQFYAGNFIAENIGKEGYKNCRRKGFCLETQYYPDTPNHEEFPQAFFGAGKDYDTTTVYKFSW